MEGKESSVNTVYRPKEVELAIKLLLTSLAFGAFVAYLNISVPPEDTKFLIYRDLIFADLIFNGFIIYKIIKNRNWARIFYILITVVGVPIFLAQLIGDFTSAPLHSILQLINILIQVSGAYLLFKKESKEWFMLVKAKR